MTEADRKKAQAERQRRAALRSSVIQELRQQYSDAPEEIRERRDFQSERESREELHRCLLVYFIWAGRHMKADESVIKWERMWGLCVMQDSEIISEYLNISYILYGISFTDIRLHHQWGFFCLCRKNYEESMMVRLNMPKHQKNSKKRSMMSMSSQLNAITHFSDITALTGGEGGQVSLQWHHRPVRTGSCFTHWARLKLSWWTMCIFLAQMYKKKKIHLNPPWVSVEGSLLSRQADLNRTGQIFYIGYCETWAATST